MSDQLANGLPKSEEGEMPILSHLRELSRHVIRAMIGVIIGTIIAFIFAGQLFNFVTSCNFPAIFVSEDLIRSACSDITAIRPTETIEIYLRLAFLTGITLSMPWIMFQLWQFIAPGLHKKEKRGVYIFVPFATILFLSGVAFAWGVLLPTALSFLKTFLADTVDIQWTAESFIDFVTGFLFWLGVAFQLPLIFYTLARFGFVTAKALREQWRFAIVGIAIAAAMITPSVDPWTMILTMAPLTVLYLFSILLARLGERQFLKSPRADEA